uniref:Phosphoglycerate mutase (2,3-diphosphoglycerate-dependent) n=1 Tax=Heterorhabditis bacteriophora TaxID=37862 RepID=A0A1I7X0S6_HETBA
MASKKCDSSSYIEESDSSTPSPSFNVYPNVLLVMRHSERVDDLFPGWIKKSTRTGKYKAYDLNMVHN